jgi:hypothetical protein
MDKTRGEGCQHLISEVAMCKTEGGYLVECHGCAAFLGVVSTPREFQALRREALRREVLELGRTTSRHFSP